MADFDENVRRALEDDETFQSIMGQLKEAATSEVTVRHAEPCPKCDCKHIRMVKVPDYKVKLAIIEFLSNRGVGRPAQASDASDEKIVFERVVYLGDDAP